MEKKPTQPLDIGAIRARLAGAQGKQFWRSLDELAETEEFQQYLEREFPRQAGPLGMEVDRRHFLKLAGASLALAGLSGCRYLPEKRIVPYVEQPEDIVPGIPLSFASAIPLGGFASGVLVTSNMGRPTKVEGNPDHPANLGATDALTQAAILTFYDPDRAQNVTNLGDISTWEAFFTAARTTLVSQRARQGAGVRILTETITSPALADQLQTFLKQYPRAKWHVYEPVGRGNAGAGARLAFGQDANIVYHFDKADRILSLDANFLMGMPGSVRYAHDFMEGRRVRKDKAVMNRLYMLESAPTITGVTADHRLPVNASEVEGAARAIAQALGVAVGTAAGAAPASVPADWIAALVRDLQSHSSTSLVVAGDHQPPSVHALAHAMNEKLGSVGTTVVYTDPVEANPVDHLQSLRELVQEMQVGQVDMLIIFDGNPVYNAPADLNFAEQLSKVPLRVHLGLLEDETSAVCQWHLPEAHPLEAWGDVRAYDGTVSIIQPLILPLYDGRSAYEVMSALLSAPRQGYDIVHDYWQRQKPGPNFEATWQKILNDGLIPDTAAPVRTVALKPDWAAGQPAAAPAPAPSAQALDILFQPDPTIWDGRFANNGWLQELPKPIIKLTWDNAALISPRTADSLNIASEQQVEIQYRGRSVLAGALVVPGHPDNSVTVYLGYGRTRAGQIGTGPGFNAYALRTSDAPWFGSGATLRKTGALYPLSTTQIQHQIEGRDLTGRDIFHSGTLDEFQKDPRLPQGEEAAEETPITLFPGPDDDYKGPGNYAWGMSIDNNVCIGCNACVVACQAENNIPVIGKVEVKRGRAMHWIRIDSYYKGASLDNPQTFFQPIPCMHCEKAPCEVVCPVAATTHSHEGLNQQIYNRCVGTRYCSNNCPYKVRRFNFYKYTAGQPFDTPDNYDIPVIKLSANPDVTVRGRGVMEKCSYCVQRINAARIEAKKADRTIRDGEVKPACQQACPTQAIIFGDINDKNSQVAKLKAEPHDYSVLADVNTRPRTTYLAKLQNPNPDIKREQ